MSVCKVDEKEVSQACKPVYVLGDFGEHAQFFEKIDEYVMCGFSMVLRGGAADTKFA